MPASTPLIQASPTTPPPASTSTSGATKGAKGWIVATPVVYAIAYACIRMALIDELERTIHIGPRVRALREAMDLSLRDLAER